MVGTLAALVSAGVGREQSVTWSGLFAALGMCVLRGSAEALSSGLDTALAAEDVRACRGKSRPGRRSDSRELCAEQKPLCLIVWPSSSD